MSTNVGILLPNWIGDVVMATPTLRALRSHYGPEAKLTGIIAALRKTDARSKGIGNRSADTCDLLKEIIYYILH